MAQSLRHKRIDVGERKFLLNGLTDSIDEEIDMIRSMDMAYANTVSTSLATIISAKTSPNRTFHVKSITVTSGSTANKVTFFSDITGTNVVVPYRIGANATYSVTELVGMNLTAMSYSATTAASIEVWVGGVWRLT